MPKYIIYFNQQWVGDHPAEWYQSRGPLARAVGALSNFPAYRATLFIFARK